MIAAVSFFWWLIFFVLWVVFLTITMSIARSKGHSPLLWGLLACVLPGITVIIVLLLPVRTQGDAAPWVRTGARDPSAGREPGWYRPRSCRCPPNW